ncbi:MAG: DUF1175 family protein [Betaproteobacteria bacterium]
MSALALSRRGFCTVAALLASAGARAGVPPAAARPQLDREQSQRFRAWMTLLVRAQLERGPTPRWTQRDCAGLVRFCVDEALRSHDADWKRANGFRGARVPADVTLDDATLRALRQSWRRVDGTRGAFAPAIDLVQENTRFVARDLMRAQAGDLMFFDMGDEQHLMVWMGHYIAYHTGRNDPGDNGLRALRPAQLYGWKDTRWRPTSDNPNFAGIYCLDFLA